MQTVKFYLRRKVAPALVAGNCAILKPSELAGLTCMFLGQLALDAGIPPGACLQRI